MNSIRQLECAIVKGNTQKASALTMKCLQEGLAPSVIIEQGILKGLEIVGQKWKTYEYFIPNVLVSAMATKLCLNVLHSSLNASGNRYIGKAVAGTVRGDVHDIGKNIVLMFMETAGFEVIDLGIDVAPEQFAKMVKNEKPDLLLLSCLYTVTMHSMEDTIIALKKGRPERKGENPSWWSADHPGVCRQHWGGRIRDRCGGWSQKGKGLINGSKP